MTYYEDLAKYEYWKQIWPLAEPPDPEITLNVGWLGKGRDFPRDVVPDRFLSRLIALAATPVHLMRGVHHCEFCDQKSPIRALDKDSDTYAWLGNGEISVRLPNGGVFLAPTLIVHYVDGHDYLPPTRFIDAVMSSWAEDQADQ